MRQAVLPGAVIGVLGSGQLGRMFAIAARRLGYRVHTFSPDRDTPTGQIADVEIDRPYDDLDAVREFARHVNVVTFEFENVPSAAVEAAEKFAPVRPGGHVLHIAQHRIREKTFLKNAGLPVTPFRPVHSLQELEEALSELGLPAVLKTAGFGYDGKGQARIPSRDAAAPAWDSIARQEAVVEAFIDFDREISVVAARDAQGNFEHYGAIENQHRHHILDVSLAPARVPEKVAAAAVEIARAVLEKLEVTGVLCVEFFLTRTGDLLINELAPRPHNSGHFSVDACMTSQFEQQLRAVCGLPLGSTRQLASAAMANLLGDLWLHGEPDWAAACAAPDIKLHLYGKLEARKGRKMGHLTALKNNMEEAMHEVVETRKALRGR
ncbi:MAG TPA: 5-(carboxyamino)imidazole ribonucleotide synthase [Bryobacteraceae bacterium]|nr:5-(carboxyamino)imidazole ribonucleotide synthase [Bryobacteraceae bacterium]